MSCRSSPHVGRIGGGRWRARTDSGGCCPSSWSRLEHKATQVDPSRRSARAVRDAWLTVEIRRVFDDNYGVHGQRKVWAQLNREGHTVARCTVQRLMARWGCTARCAAVLSRSPPGSTPPRHVP